MLQIQEKEFLVPGNRLWVDYTNASQEGMSDIYNRDLFFCGISRTLDSIQLSLALEYVRVEGRHILLPISFSLKHSGSTTIKLCFDGEPDILTLLVTNYDIEKNIVTIVNAPPDHVS